MAEKRGLSEGDWRLARAALEADGERLRAMTGEDHGPFWPDDDVICPRCGERRTCEVPVECEDFDCPTVMP